MARRSPTHPIAALANGVPNPQPYDAVHELEREMAKTGRQIQPRFLRGPHDPEIVSATPFARSWQLRGQRSHPVNPATRRMPRYHPRRGRESRGAAVTAPTGWGETPAPTARAPFTYTSMRAIEATRSPRQKREIMLRRLERDVRTRLIAGELAKLKMDNFNLDQRRQAKKEANAAALQKLKQWRKDVDDGLIDIPWDLLEARAEAEAAAGGATRRRRDKAAWADPDEVPRFGEGPTGRRRSGEPPALLPFDLDAVLRPSSRSGQRRRGKTKRNDFDDALSLLQPPSAANGAKARGGGGGGGGGGALDDGSTIGPLSAAHLEIVFDEVDADHNGSVSVDELFDAIQNNPVVQQVLGFTADLTGAEQAEFTRLFETIDANHDESITLKEFETYVFGARGAQRSSADTDPTETAEEREVRAQLAELQMELLGRQHRLANAVHVSLDVVPAERVEVAPLEEQLRDEERTLETYAYLVSRLEQIEAAKAR